MKRIFFFLPILAIAWSISYASPILNKSKYLISTLNDGGDGTVSPGTTTYPLIYNVDNNNETAAETDYWIIKKQADNTYTFQNYLTKQYIKYNSTSAERTALTLVDVLQTDKSTSFTLELRTVSGMSFYTISCVANPVKVWDRRVSLHETYYPVGVYNATGTNNQLFIFSDSEGTAVADDSTIPVKPTGSQSLGAFGNYVDFFKFNMKTPAVDTSKKEFYVTIPESDFDNSFTMKVTFKPRNSSYKLYIDNREATDGSLFTFNSVTATSLYTLEIRDGASSVATGTLKFTCLPIVQVYSNITISSIYSSGRIVVTEPEKPDSAELLNMNIRVRGATASGKPKKPYAVKLKDLDGVSSLDRSFLGFRNDNNWILDAMYIDPARMRNRVSTDLWNEFATLPYFSASEPKLRNGTRGGFVEVFLNDSYNGLYCLTEKVDRKQLNVKKLKYNVDSTVVTQRGGMYKGSSWTISTLLGKKTSDMFYNATVPAYNNGSETWSGYENKYPDLGDGEPIEWKPLYDAVNVSSDYSSDANFLAKVDETYDLPVFLDYYLFIELLLATDNQGKNTYLSVYDQSVSPKLTITPWDLDGVWGRRWEGSSNLTYANQNFETFINTYEHSQNNLYLRLFKLNHNNFKTNLRSRYEQLRGSYFSYSSLYGRFEQYYNIFMKSGAGAREMSRWGSSNMTNEITFISNWITQRLSYLDNQYLGGPYINSGVTTAGRISFSLYPNPVRDFLTISGINTGDRIQLISMQGVLMQQLTAEGNRATIDMSGHSPGVYIVKVNNQTMKVIRN